MVQPSKRSYYYFLSFAASQKSKKSKRARASSSSSSSRRRSCCVAKTRKLSKFLSNRPPWDNTTHDLSAWKLSAAELEAKNKAYKSTAHYSSKRSSVTLAPGQLNSPRSNYADDRSLTSSLDEGAASVAHLTRRSVTTPTDINLASPVRSEKSFREQGTILDPKLSVNGASKEGCPVTNRKTGIAISRFGKENKILKSLLDVTATPANVKSRPIISSSNVLVNNGRDIPQSSAVRTDCVNVQGATQLTFPSLSQGTSLAGVSTNEPSTCSSPTTVDFEDEVKQFEIERRQLLLLSVPRVTRPRPRILHRSPRTATVGKKRCKRLGELYGIPLTGLKLPFRSMDKSSPTRYTHQPSFRGGVIDSSDDSVSGPLENLRWQKGSQSASKHRRPHNKKIPDTEGHHPTEKVQSFNWEPQPQKKELVHFKNGPPISDIKIQSSGRIKMVKRHCGSIQKTSPIMQWNKDLEGDSDDQLSHQKDLRQYIVKCHHELMKEFKDFKLSLSRQIMNLQLDVDKILANQQEGLPKGFKGLLPSHRPGPAAEGTIQELVGENLELPPYSSLKVRQEMVPASPLSGESYHLPSSKLESQYPDTRKETDFGSWNQEEIGRRPRTSNISYAAPTESHIFRNLQNNPIYHVQSSSEKIEGSTDSNASVSSVEQTRLDFCEERGNLLETRPESDARDYLSPEERNTASDSRRATCSQSVPGLQCKKSNGNSHSGPLVEYGKVPGHELGMRAEIAHTPENHDLSFKDSWPANNGHSHSHHVRSGRLDEQCQTGNNEATLASILQSGSSKAPRKDEINMSNLLGTYTAKGKTSKENDNCPQDADLHLGTRGPTSGRNSPYTAEKKPRSSLSVSRPLFGEELGQTSWENVSTTSPTSIYSRETPKQLYEKAGAQQGWTIYPREEPQSQQYGNAGAEQGRSNYTTEEPQSHQYGKAGAEHGRPIYIRGDTQSQEYGKAGADQESQQYGKSGAEQGRPINTREEARSQQYGKVGVEQGRHTYFREEPQSDQYRKAGVEQGRARSKNSTFEMQREGDPFTLRGWAAAFLDPPAEITIKSQEITLQSLTVSPPKTDGPSSGQHSPTKEQSAVQESPNREQHREKENGSQYAVRQFAGKSSKGGCAWTVSEPANSHKSSPKESPANGTTTSKGRQKHHYSVNNY